MEEAAPPAFRLSFPGLESEKLVHKRTSGPWKGSLRLLLQKAKTQSHRRNRRGTVEGP